MLGITEPTGHRWLDDYNEKGFRRLISKIS
ncbi:MAG: hypothetical protein LBB45_00645 [Methanobrevibacter sp.]|nr:hypothetical protein [Candidatus Methanovirga basalitermitum]